MTNPAVTVAELIQEIKKAVEYVERDGSVKISLMELDVKTTLETTYSGEVVWKVLTLKGSSKNSEVQTLHLKFKPSPPGKHGLTAENLKDELITAMNVIKIGMNEALDKPPYFTLEEGTVEFCFGVTQEGQIQVFKLGAGAKDEQTHSLKLTLTLPS